MARTLPISERVAISADELDVQFVRSSGPGGQNVNKVNTKAILRWKAMDTTSLPTDVKTRFLERYAGRLTRDGELVVSADVHRQQGQNLAACREKLRGLVLAVLEPPRSRRATRPSRSSVERRLQGKRRQSQKKGGRRLPDARE